VLRFFRINDPYRLLGVLFVLIIIALPLWIDAADLTWLELKNRVLGEAVSNHKFMYVEVYDDAPPLAAFFMGIMDWCFGRSVFAWQMIAFLLILFQCSYFGIVLISSKAYQDNTYLPSLIYGILAFFSFDLFSFSPELLASTFLLFTINNLFKEIEFRIQREDIVLIIGFTLGITSLLVFSYLVFLPAIIFLLTIYARVSLRKVLLLISGVLLPHGIVFFFYFLNGSSALLWQKFYLPNLYFLKSPLISSWSLFLLALLPLSYFLFSLIMLNRVARFTRYQSQLLQVMFIWLAPCAMLTLLTKELAPHTFYVFIPVFSYFISHYFLLIRRKWIAETMFWIFFLGTVGVLLFARYGKIKSIDYSEMLVTHPMKLPKGEKILVLGDHKEAYIDHTVGGYFLNWNLSREVFENPDYFENIIIINNSFQNDPPDIIIDEKDLMRPIMNRIPELQKNYKRVESNYIKISN
jgi:hypothetical protein